MNPAARYARRVTCLLPAQTRQAYEAEIYSHVWALYQEARITTPCEATAWHQALAAAGAWPGVLLRLSWEYWQTPVLGTALLATLLGGAAYAMQGNLLGMGQ